jgi:hypothetical protein
MKPDGMVTAIRDFWLTQNTAPPEPVALAKQLAAEPDEKPETAAKEA